MFFLKQAAFKLCAIDTLLGLTYLLELLELELDVVT